MRFSLRTLVIVMLLAGPLCAYGWQRWQAYQEHLAREAAQARAFDKLYAPKTGGLGLVRNLSAAERELWAEQRNKITWESFPESQPPQRFTPPSPPTSGD